MYWCQAAYKLTVQEEPEAKEPITILVNNQANAPDDQNVPPTESCKSRSPTRAGAPGGSVSGRDTITGSTCNDAE